MYKTPRGDRTPDGAERRVFTESLGMITDFLSDGNDFQAGIDAFDDLQCNQKIAVLLGVSRALLRANVPAPPLTAVSEAAVAAIYCNMLDQVLDEIDNSSDESGDADSDEHQDEQDAGPSWRELVLLACRQTSGLTDLPDAENTDPDEWELLIDGLRDQILWDADFEMLEHTDADPDHARALKDELGIADEYFVYIPPDPTDQDARRMITELRYLTPEGRNLDPPPPA